MRFSRTQKGFTLVELLIVIAIVGILATLVIVSLRQASDRSRNAKITTDVVQIRKIAEQMYIEEMDGYTSLCTDSTTLNDTYDPTLGVLQDDIEEYGGSIAGCYSAQYSYCISARFTGADAKWFCIDDEGNNVEATVNPCTMASDTCQ